ncbi:hypothetical protein ACFQ0M_32645 [Kitasatospora aburaviensis]
MAQEPRIDVALTLLGRETEPTEAERAELAASLKPEVWFATPKRIDVGEPRPADFTWDLVGDPYKGEIPTGQAAVYLANPKLGLRRPFLFADGFNYGPSELPDLFAYFNTPYQPGTPGFFDQLLARGIDVVLIGFEKRHTHIQANAGVAISAITRVIAERVGDAPLTVGGVSMGGIVTRYALAKLEHEGVDHQTATYLSYDSPHNGAWIPLVLQQMAYFFEDFTPRRPVSPSRPS